MDHDAGFASVSINTKHVIYLVVGGIGDLPIGDFL